MSPARKFKPSKGGRVDPSNPLRNHKTRPYNRRREKEKTRTARDLYEGRPIPWWVREELALKEQQERRKRRRQE